MKKYFVIGNPIDHSLSPKLHNYWIKENNIDSVYEKKKINLDQLEDIILEIKQKKINGINVTVPFKQEIIKYLDKLSPEATATQSVNTIYLDNNKAVGHNTDITGFTLSLKKINLDPINKKIFILGAGGVVPSIVYSLNKMKSLQITISNRTKEKADRLKKLFNNIKIVEWGEIPEFDMIINATSIGLNNDDNINLDFSNIKNKFFYDVIYNPQETNFLKKAKNQGNKISNGEMMFIYQASAAFHLWHKVQPRIDEEVIKLLNR
jgi:shikimate dehydrogenase